MGEKENEREEFIHAIRKFMEMRTLTKQVLNELIDRIDVYETQGTGKNKTQRLVIYYKFVGYLDIDPTQCRPNYTADIYNTYINNGLPPSPICMPGRNAIDAVLDFERHDYMFFCARPTFDGYHNFARTLREHNANARAYSAELNRRKIR